MFKFAALTALRQLRCGRRSIATPWGCELSNNRPLLLTLSNLERETRFVSGNRVVVTPWGCELSNNYPLLLTRSDLERETRFELATPTLARLCSTTELFPRHFMIYDKITRCHQQRVRILQKLAGDARVNLHLYEIDLLKCSVYRRCVEEKHNSGIHLIRW